MKTIFAAFVNAKRAFGPALKDKKNPAFKSSYADLGACIEAVEQALLDNGLAFVQETFDDATGVTVETMFIHESGESMRCGKLHVPAAKQDPQGYGSALTYCRRYSLMTACGIAPEDDDGNAGARPTQQPAARPAQPQAKDMSPAAVAGRITAGVARGEAAGAAQAMSGFAEGERDAVWALLNAATQTELTANWPALEAA